MNASWNRSKMGIGRNEKTPKGRYKLIIFDSITPEGRRLINKKTEPSPSPCEVRQMTDEEREKYGLPPLPKPEEGINPKADPVFAAKVREERERLGMSLNKFSEYLGIDHKTLTNIEKCRNKTSKSTREHICSVLGWECE